MRSTARWVFPVLVGPKTALTRGAAENTPMSVEQIGGGVGAAQASAQRVRERGAATKLLVMNDLTWGTRDELLSLEEAHATLAICRVRISSSVFARLSPSGSFMAAARALAIA